MSEPSQPPILPPGFLFRYTLPVLPAPGLPAGGASKVRLGPEHRLASLSEITGQPEWMQLSMGWNSRGLGLVAETSEITASEPRKLFPPPFRFVWTLRFDLRDTKNIHRANRFCISLGLYVPRGEEWSQSEIRQHTLERAREPPPPLALKLVHHRIQETGRKLRVELWLPAETLPGFDPAEQRRIGFDYDLEESRLGHQALGLDRSFPTNYDPSLWQSLELVGDA